MQKSQKGWLLNYSYYLLIFNLKGEVVEDLKTFIILKGNQNSDTIEKIIETSDSFHTNAYALGVYIRYILQLE